MQTKLMGAHKILPHLLTVVEAFKIVLPLLGALDGVLALRHALGEVHPDRITATDLREQSVPASGIVRYANLAFLDQRSTAGVEGATSAPGGFGTLTLRLLLDDFELGPFLPSCIDRQP